MNEKKNTIPCVCIDLIKHRVRIHKNTLRLLQNPRYIELLVNPKKQGFIIRTSSNNKNAHHIMIEHLPARKPYVELYSREFIQEICSVSEKLEPYRSYRIEGCMSNGCDAAFFALEDSVVLNSGKDRTAYA